MDEVKSDQEAASTWRQESQSCSQPALWTSRGGCLHCSAPRDAAKQACSRAAVAVISEAIKEKVAHRMRQVSVLDLNTTAEELESTKSGKLRTDDSSDLHKVVWLHELVYTVAGQPAVYDDITITSLH